MFSKNYFQKAPIKEIKKVWLPPTRLLKKLPLETPKTSFLALHYQLQNIQCKFKNMKLPCGPLTHFGTL